LSLIDFWLSTAVQRPLGTLTNYSIEDIEIDANWGGEPGLFVKVLLEVGFLDEKDGVYSLHNWNVRQGWVSGTEERADKARFSRLARSNPSLYKELKAKGVDSISKEDYQKRKKSFNGSSTVVNEPLNESSTVVEEDSTPSPSPSPTPNVRETPISPLKKFLENKIEADGFQDIKNQIIEFFKYRMAYPKAKQYKNEKGINGLFRDLAGCRDRGLNLAECLEITMEKTWLTPSPDYFKNNNFGGKNGSPQHNYTGIDNRPSILPDRDLQV